MRLITSESSVQQKAPFLRFVGMKSYASSNNCKNERQNKETPTENTEGIGKPLVIDFIIAFVVVIYHNGKHDQTRTSKRTIHYPCRYIMEVDSFTMLVGDVKVIYPNTVAAVKQQKHREECVGYSLSCRVRRI